MLGPMQSFHTLFVTKTSAGERRSIRAALTVRACAALA